MSDFWATLSAKLASRKFLLALSTALGLIAAGQHGEAAAVVAAYIFGQGAVDAVAVRKSA